MSRRARSRDRPVFVPLPVSGSDRVDFVPLPVSGRGIEGVRTEPRKANWTRKLFLLRYGLNLIQSSSNTA